MQWKAIAQFLTPQVFKLIWNFIRFNYYLTYFFLLQTSNTLYLIQKQLAGGGGGGFVEGRGRCI